MCGRKEKDLQLEEKINMLLKDAPNLICKFITSISLTKTANTRYVYTTYLKHFNSFLNCNNIQITEVKPMDIDEYIIYSTKGKNGKINGAQIINARLSAIISFYNFLVENQIIDKNPCSSKKKLNIDEKDTVTYMTPEEVMQIKNIIRSGKNRQKKYIDRDLAIIELGCTTGLRVSAIANIDMQDINFQERSIYVIEKGAKKRKIYFGENTEEALIKWINTRNEILNNEEIQPLFISKLKTRITKDAISDMLKNAVKEAGINKKITPHKMRSTCGMNLYGATGDIKLTQDVLGHSNIRNTMIYVKATERQKKEAINILDSLY